MDTATNEEKKCPTCGTAMTGDSCANCAPKSDDAVLEVSATESSPEVTPVESTEAPSEEAAA